MLGLYSFSIADFDNAINNFITAGKKVKNNENEFFSNFYQALVYLSQNQGEKAVGLVNFFQSSNIEKNSNNIIGASKSFIEGLLYHHQNKYQLSRQKIKDCLSLTNGILAHNQLASYCLNILGSIYIKENTNLVHAVTILKSSLVISYRCEDLTNQLYTIYLLSILYSRQKDHINESYNTSYQITTEGDLLERINKAKQKEESRLITYYLDQDIEMTEVK